MVRNNPAIARSARDAAEVLIDSCLKKTRSRRKTR
jgi:hypothetical protein